jgi:predicted small lipoprotein YifL
MRNAFSTVSILASLVALAACGGNAEPPADPSAVATPSSASPSTPTAPAAPAEATATDGTKPSSGAPASPAEGKCKSGEAPASAKDYDACLSGCRGLDDRVPEGSKCIPAKTSCIAQCSTKFKK